MLSIVDTPFLIPPLTTISQTGSKWERRPVDMIERDANHEEVSCVILQPSLVVRRSTERL